MNETANKISNWLIKASPGFHRGRTRPFKVTWFYYMQEIIVFRKDGSSFFDKSFMLLKISFAKTWKLLQGVKYSELKNAFTNFRETFKIVWKRNRMFQFYQQKLNFHETLVTWLFLMIYMHARFCFL